MPAPGNLYSRMVYTSLNGFCGVDEVLAVLRKMETQQIIS